MGGRRGGEEVTPPLPFCTPVPLAPSQNTTLQQQQREERRLLDHRPPRQMETDRQTDTIKRKQGGQGRTLGDRKSE